MKTNRNGIPDIIAVKPDSVKFIEVKTKRNKTSPLQDYRIKELRELGFDVEVFQE